MEYLAALNKKERKAWEHLYREYYASLCTYVYRIVRDRDSAEDIVQDTLINIWRSGHSFQEGREFNSYLYRSVYLNSVQFLRTRGLHEAHLSRVQQEFGGREDDLAFSIREELVRKLRAAIDEMPGQRGKIMQLALEGLPGKEIAEQLGITIHTVKTQKRLALAHLRERLGKMYFLIFIYFPLKPW
ncbi:MAG: RNA polymerase sigma-70 factor [Odoribacteraceae bacterium]|jgi:RNA polymerase sigma-70 factor (ECF subfamily)|nr:RNA polymerase sigma-70 factor [Odoribacteraceae bacterium]